AEAGAGHTDLARADELAVRRDRPRIQRRRAGDELEDAAGLIQVADGSVFKLITCAAAQVMSLKTLPGSYRSLMALLRHWACWAACRASVRCSPVRESTWARSASSTSSRG